MSARGSYPKGRARREEILEATFEALSRDGYRKTSLREIGRALGLQPAHILYYFGSREELLQEVVTRWSSLGPSLMTGDTGGENGSTDALDEWLAAVRWNMQHYGLVFLYTTFAAEASDPQHPAHHYFVERFSTLKRLIAAAIARRQEQGSIDPALDPDRSALRLIALSDGLQLQWLADQSVDMAVELKAAIDDLRPVRPAARTTS